MSGIGRYIVDAVVLEHRSPTQLARDHGISKRWVFELLRRFKEGGYAGLKPRSRRPHSCSHQVPADVQAQVLRLREELLVAGHDAGPATIAYHLLGKASQQPSVATVWRILKRQGLITPQPHKRPRSSFIRFVAKLPNETWQIDATPWQPADGRSVEILNFEDDHSRLFLASRAFPTLRASDVVATFHAAAREFDLPASLLSDNAAVFTGRSRRGKVMLELELARLGVQQKYSSTYHPRPAARSNASTRPSSASSPSSRRRPRWPTFNGNWTPSATTTTTAGHTAPSTAKPRPRSSIADSRPGPPNVPLPSTTASAATRSTASASSPSAIWVGSATSRSASPTKTARCTSSSPAPTSASSPRTASSYAL